MPYNTQADYLNAIKDMPSLKSDITIAIKAGGKSFSLNCIKLPDRSYLVKRGRSRSEKMPTATLSQIFDTARKWAVRQAR